jgi:hypothetical protein
VTSTVAHTFQSRPTWTEGAALEPASTWTAPFRGPTTPAPLSSPYRPTAWCSVRFGIDSHGAERDGEGNATYTRNLIPGLLATDAADEFKLFAADRDHPFYGPVRTCGRAQVVSVYQGKGLARLGWSLARAARRERVDALHVQYVAPLRYRGPLVITVHDLGFVNVPDSFPFALRALLRVLVPWSMARASQIITVSEFCRRDILCC